MNNFMEKKFLTITLYLCTSFFFNVYSQEENTFTFYENGEKIILNVQNTNPDHYPLINFSYGIGFAATSHELLQVVSNFDGYFKYLNFGSITFNYNYLPGFWKKISNDEDYSNNLAPKYSYSNFSIGLNIPIKKNYLKKDVPVYYKQKDLSLRAVEITSLLVPAKILRHFDVSVGFINSKDIIPEGALSSEDINVYSKDGYQLDNTFINYKNNILKLGCIYGIESYVRSKIDDRQLQKIGSRNIYSYVLFSNESKIEDVQYYNGNVYAIDSELSKLITNKIGFILGYSNASSNVFPFLGTKAGVELGLYPGIKGFTNTGNLFLRIYLDITLHFLKNNGKQWQI